MSPSCCCGGPLQPEVQRQPHALARDRLLALEARVEHRAAEGVDLDALLSVHAAQVAVVGALQPALADHRARGDAAEAWLLGLLLADLADRAEDLRADRVVGIGPQVGLVDGHAGKQLRALGDVRQRRGRHVGLQARVGVGHEHQRAHDAAVHLAARQTEHPAQALVALAQLLALGPRDRDRLAAVALGPRAALGHGLTPLRRQVALGLRQLGGVDLDHHRDVVGDDRPAVAIDDVPARSLDAQVAHAVDRRLREELVARQHLQVPEAEEHDREQRERDAAEDRHPQRELGRDRGAAAA